MKKTLITIALLLPLAIFAQQGKFHVALGIGHTSSNMWEAGYAAGWQFNSKFDIGWEFRLNSTPADLKDAGTITHNWDGLEVGYNLTGKEDFQIEPYVGYYVDMAQRIDGEPIPKTVGYRIKIQKSVSPGTAFFIQAGHYKVSQVDFGIEFHVH